MLDYDLPGGHMDAVHDCYYDKKTDPEVMSYEMKQFRRDNFESIFMQECEGKQNCKVTIAFEDFARNPPNTQRLNMLLFA